MQRRASRTNSIAPYAHVWSPHTLTVANQLTDRLVDMGFEELEAAAFVTPVGHDLFEGQAPPREIPPPSNTFEVPRVLAEVLRSALNEPHRRVVDLDEARCAVTLVGHVSAETYEAAIAAAPRNQRPALSQIFERHEARVTAVLAPAQHGERFLPLPQLAVPVQGRLELLEPGLVAELMEFSLAGAPADLPDFTAQDDERPYLIDVVRGHVAISQEQPQYVLDLNAPTAILRREDLIRALDRRVRRDDVLQPDMIAWLGRVLDALEARGIELAYCARHANRLADCIIARIAGLSMHARARAFQGLLLEGPARARLSDFHTFRFAPDRYPARWLHQGRYQFARHFYGAPGELDDSIEQEETACAIALDQMNDVRHWVRNLERQPVSSFWLPTASDRFYPDFVVQLEDGRLLVVEYKGAHLYGNPDSREKRDIGMLWAASSNGRCVFLMATHPSAAGGVAVPARLRAAISAS